MFVSAYSSVWFESTLPCKNVCTAKAQSAHSECHVSVAGGAAASHFIPVHPSVLVLNLVFCTSDSRNKATFMENEQPVVKQGIQESWILTMDPWACRWELSAKYWAFIINVHLMPASRASSSLRLPQHLCQWWTASWECDLGLGHYHGSYGPPAAPRVPDPWLKVISLLLRACKTPGAWLTPSGFPPPLQCVSNRLMLAHEGQREPAEKSPRERKILTIHRTKSHTHMHTEKTSMDIHTQALGA